MRKAAESKKVTASWENRQDNPGIWRALVSSAPDFIIIIDRRYKFLYLNRVQDGLRVDDFIGKSAVDLVAKEDQEWVTGIYNRVFKTGIIENFQIKSVTGPDTIGWYQVRVGPLREEKKINSLIIISRDITSDMRGKEQLKVSEKRYKNLYNQTPVLMFSLDFNGKIVNVNDRWLELSGLTRSGLIGKKPSRFFKIDGGTNSPDKVDEMFKKKQLKYKSFRLRKLDGTYIPVLVSTNTEYDAKKKAIGKLAVAVEVPKKK